MNCQSKEKCLGEVIKQLARKNPNAVAIVSSKYKPLSYSQLVCQIELVANNLNKSGFRASSRIAISVNDAAPAALAIVAVACFATAVPLDPKLTYAEIEIRFKILTLDAVCVLKGENSVIKRIAEKFGITIIELTLPDKMNLIYSVPIQNNTTLNTSVETIQDKVAVILQTSGTTAEPKFVPCLHSNLLATVERVCGWFSLTESDRCLSIVPSYHNHGLTITLLAPLLSGGSIAFPTNYTDVNVVEWLQALKPTWFSASPTMHLAISEKLGSRPMGFQHFLRFAVSGGAHLSEDVRLRLHQILGIYILSHYGMTEASQISANLPNPKTYKSSTVGIPPIGTLIVVDNNGRPLSPGEQGEIWIRGPNVMNGYLNGNMLDKTSFQNGWFQTGDIGCLDKDGFLTIHDRIKEQINRGGEKISPFEVEAVILKHPDVLESVVFAVPHQRLGEDLAAAVVLRPGTSMPLNEFRQFMNKYLSWTKIPRQIHFVQSIPRGNSGKILRKKLREQYS